MPYLVSLLAWLLAVLALLASLALLAGCSSSASTARGHANAHRHQRARYSPIGATVSLAGPSSTARYPADLGSINGAPPPRRYRMSHPPGPQCINQIAGARRSSRPISDISLRTRGFNCGDAHWQGR